MTFDDIKFWFDRVMSFFDIKGGVIIGLFSVEVLALIPYYAVIDVPFPATVRDVYLGVIAAFAVSNTAKKIAEARNAKP